MLKASLTAAALLAASSANAALIYEQTGTLSDSRTGIYSVLPLTPDIAPGQYRIDVTFDQDSFFANPNLGIKINYSQFCQPGPFKCGGNNETNAIPFTRVDLRHYAASFTLKAGYTTDTSQSSYFVYDDEKLIRGTIEIIPVDPANPISYRFALTSVPEPASWALMIAGFGLAGAAARRRKPAFA